MEEPNYRFTLRSLRAVVTIICVLLALFVPAIQAAREASRRSECSNNLKQIGLALHNFHDTYNRLPPGMTGEDTNQYGWGTHIIPFAEASPYYNQLYSAGMRLQFGGPVRDGNGAPASTATLVKELHVDANLRSPSGTI